VREAKKLIEEYGVRGFKTRGGLDFLFGALKAAPDDASARHDSEIGRW
jgi:hypothetical protein